MPGTVTVACKLPHGLILRLFEMVDHDEAQPGGGYKTIKRARPRGEEIRIKGYQEPNRNVPPPAMDGSYALTHGVDKDFFDEWMKQNADHPAVKNKLIFASEKTENVRAQVRENEGRRSGFEPIDPDKLPRGLKTYSRDTVA